MLATASVLSLLIAGVPGWTLAVSASRGDPDTPADLRADAGDGATMLAFPAVTRPKRDLELAFGVSGRLQAMHVRRGERVIAGQLLAQLDGDDLAATVRLLELRAKSDHEVSAALADAEFAEQTHQRVRAAYEQDAAKEREVDDAWARLRTARAELELAKQRRAEAAIELDAARARHAKTRMCATFAGIVEDVRLEAGGAVDELAPVLRLVDDSAFRVDVAVPIELTMGLSIGQELLVRGRASSADGAISVIRESMFAKIVSLAIVADAASRTRIVRLEMPNPAKLPAGLPVDVLVPKPTDEGAPMLSGVSDDSGADGETDGETDDHAE